MKKIIFTTMTILWMIVIFMFSAKPADESTQMSRSVGKLVGEILISDFKEWPEERQEIFAERIDYPVRKCAHASEYAILGMLLVLSVSCYKRKNNVAYAFVIGTIYAAGDEFHQLFVEGRSGQLSDVCVDSAGALLGAGAAILLCLLLLKLFKRKKSRNSAE